MRDRETPLPLLRKWLRSCPDAYRQLDSCATANGEDGFAWPDYCPLPINAAYTYLTYARGRSELDAAANVRRAYGLLGVAAQPHHLRRR